MKSTRGPGGGYHLASAASEIAIADIITAVDESVDATRCGGGEGCDNHQRCLTHDLWEGLSDQIHVFLSGITLEDAISKQQVLDTAARQDALRNNEQTIEFQTI